MNPSDCVERERTILFETAEKACYNELAKSDRVIADLTASSKIQGKSSVFRASKKQGF
ncbi:MAG: hypothetical protein ACLTU3_02935 [Acutalibacteraceae bacterium]